MVEHKLDPGRKNPALCVAPPPLLSKHPVVSGTHPGGRSGRRAPGHRGRPHRGGGSGPGWHSGTSYGSACHRSLWGSLGERGPLDCPPRHGLPPKEMLREGTLAPNTGAWRGLGHQSTAIGLQGHQKPKDPVPRQRGSLGAGEGIQGQGRMR